MPRAGDIVAGKYLIVRVLGEGGMGVVYEATHQRLRQRVALKMLLPAMLEHPVIVSRFEREARAAAQLRGRHVARVSDVDVTPDGLPYMVMDFLEGHDLQVEIERRARLPIPEAVDYILQASAAMVEAHSLGIVHRDLKPSNLFLATDYSSTGEPGRILKVLDFGISKLQADDANLTEANTVVGTALYMSPEQVKASHAVDARTDIWALGVILYETFAGRVPWLGSTHQVAAAIVTEDAPDVRGFNPEVPPDLAAIVHKALERDPARRFGDVRELAAALAPYATPGSLGRLFGDNALTASLRVPVVRRFESSNSLAPAEDPENAKTVVNAPGVSEELLRIHVSSEPAPKPPALRSLSRSSSRTAHRRAALAGVAVAFVITLVSVGSIVLFVHRSPQPQVSATSEAVPRATDPSAAGGGPDTAAASDPSQSARVPSPPHTSGVETPAPSPQTAPVATAAKKPAPVASTVASAAPNVTSPSAPPPKSTPKPAKSATPNATSSAPQDKPLFL